LFSFVLEPEQLLELNNMLAYKITVMGDADHRKAFPIGA
jgi:hypothetical protein